MADVLELQEFEPAVQFKVRNLRDFGYDEVIKHRHRPLPPQKWAGASGSRSTPLPSVKILCVADSLFS